MSKRELVRLWCVWIKFGWLALVLIECSPQHLRTNVPKGGKVVGCGSLFPKGERVYQGFCWVYVQEIVKSCGILFHILLWGSSEIGMSVCWWFKLIEIIAPIIVIEIVPLKFCKGEKGMFLVGWIGFGEPKLGILKVIGGKIP